MASLRLVFGILLLCSVAQAQQYGTFAVGSKESQDNERGLLAAGYVRVPGENGGWHWSKPQANQPTRIELDSNGDRVAVARGTIPLGKIRALSDYWGKPDT